MLLYLIRCFHFPGPGLPPLGSGLLEAGLQPGPWAFNCQVELFMTKTLGGFKTWEGLGSTEVTRGLPCGIPLACVGTHMETLWGPRVPQEVAWGQARPGAGGHIPPHPWHHQARRGSFHGTKA